MGYLERKRDSLIGGVWWNIAGKTCIAAYRFKGADSKSASYQDLTGNGHTLNAPRGIEWTAENGVQFGYNNGNQFLTNNVPEGDTLRTLTTVKTIVVYYKGRGTSSDTTAIRFSRLSMNQKNAYYGNYSVYDGCPILYGKLGFQREQNGSWVSDYSKYPGMLAKWTRIESTNKYQMVYYRSNQVIPTTGVLACNLDWKNASDTTMGKEPTNAQLYLNGARITTTKYTVTCENMLTTEIGGSGNSYHEGYEVLQSTQDNYIYAAAFFADRLSDTEHQTIYEKMRSL